MLLEDTLAAGFAALGVTPDSGAAARYRIYFEHLEKMNAVMNLTAISGEEDVARLHFLDCAALLGMADFRGRRVIDVGTGAGFPGLALKIACPDMELTLLDSLDKRIGFCATPARCSALTTCGASMPAPRKRRRSCTRASILPAPAPSRG